MTTSEAREVIREFDGTLLYTKLCNIGLSDVEIAEVMLAIQSTCHHCWNGDSGCQCWNDE